MINCKPETSATRNLRNPKPPKPETSIPRPNP